MGHRAVASQVDAAIAATAAVEILLAAFSVQRSQAGKTFSPSAPHTMVSIPTNPPAQALSELTTPLQLSILA